MAVAGCINAYDCAGCYLTTLQQLQSDNIGVAINYTAPGEYGRRQLDYIKYTDKCGCTCCLTGENELRIVATQGVIKNFTLTNDDTNEVVNVKWNDLFGSNRAYTMVRYKTGSYPTSITDGTLAVKETTQNQYATNGYNVSGLTDGTTYYFTAFAVSQDGTIIDVQNKTVKTDFGWKPSTDTLAYWKLESDYNDTMGNYNSNGQYNVGFTTLSSGKKVARLNSSTGGISVPGSIANQLNGDFTIAFWLYLAGVKSSYTLTLGFWKDTNPYYGPNVRMRTSSTNLQFRLAEVSGGYVDSPTSYTAIQNKRVHICRIRKNNVNKCYINANLDCQFTSSLGTTNGDTGRILSRNTAGQSLNSGSMGSEFIVEKVGRDETKLIHYFNKNKSLYGIS